MGFLKSLFNREPKPGEPMPTTDETFEADVLNSSLPTVVDFWSPTCPPCQVMSGLLRDVGPEYADQVKIYKMNVSENPETAMKFRIRSVPTLVFIKNKRIVDQIVGLAPLNNLRQRLNNLAAVPSSKKR